MEGRRAGPGRGDPRGPPRPLQENPDRRREGRRREDRKGPGDDRPRRQLRGPQLHVRRRILDKAGGSNKITERRKGRARMKRRDFVDIFLGGSLLATIAAFLYPVVRYVLPSRSAGCGVQNSVIAAKAGELPPNTAKVFKVGLVPGVLGNTAGGEVRG